VKSEREPVQSARRAPTIASRQRRNPKIYQLKPRWHHLWWQRTEFKAHEAPLGSIREPDCKMIIHRRESSKL